MKPSTSGHSSSSLAHGVSLAVSPKTSTYEAIACLNLPPAGETRKRLPVGTQQEIVVSLQ